MRIYNRFQHFGYDYHIIYACLIREVKLLSYFHEQTLNVVFESQQHFCQIMNIDIGTLGRPALVSDSQTL